MTYVIGTPCISVCDTACVEVCPVDCIYAPVEMDEIHRLREESGVPEGEPAEELKGLMLYIHPDECIDCAACEPECPPDAIRAEDDTHPDFDVDEYLEINTKFFEEGKDAYNTAGLR